MNTIRYVRVVAWLAATLLMTNASAAPAADLDELMSADGLEKIEVKGIDVAYALPGATLAGYNKVIIDPIEVSFRKDWDPKKTGSNLKLSAEDRENIRTGVARIVHDEFIKELQANSSYQVVNEVGPDVMRVEAMIINLYVNAPDTMSAGRSRTYAVSAGEMTLVIQLHDSESGAVIARAIDRREARNAGGMMLSSSVVNAAEARSIATAWARILRSALDKAHGIGKD